MMPNSSDTNSEFLQEMQGMDGVVPLNTPNRANTLAGKRSSLSQQLKREALEKQIALDDNGLSIDYVTPLDPHDFLSYKQDGVQDGVYKNLRLGKYQIDSRFSVKGLKFDDARLGIFNTITACHEKGIRTILIEHGLGLNSKPFPAFMKSYVNQWLHEMEAVIAFHTALKQHGGLGSVYVLLKKHANQKQINRERHQARY
ncbi:DNA endonuclease SmrA [Glaciecola petra]|uniref:DNA endonuclease SmrA n=1 Tax=Glaciecola petra TaxID=3075602 RepID=A0ABU2ZM58_9ALTE|nr:DNA endonuclease SmrA [Aestuariibacter sp. P117]MDT0593718.1 DNA endonuclease SmrA [Aestuariibacter sp. P117]